MDVTGRTISDNVSDQVLFKITHSSFSFFWHNIGKLTLLRQVNIAALHLYVHKAFWLGPEKPNNFTLAVPFKSLNFDFALVSEYAEDCQTSELLLVFVSSRT